MNSILFLPTAPSHEACPGVWLMQPVMLHQRELVFPSPKRNNIELVWDFVCFVTVSVSLYLSILFDQRTVFPCRHSLSLALTVFLCPLLHTRSLCFQRTSIPLGAKYSKVSHSLHVVKYRVLQEPYLMMVEQCSVLLVQQQLIRSHFIAMSLLAK